MFRKLCHKTRMMESNSFFHKALLIVAIMGKYFQCGTRLIFKSIWCYNSDDRPRPRFGNFCKSLLCRRAQIFVEKKIYNSNIVDT